MSRPAAAINWTEVDKLLKAGCDGVQVAAHLGIHPNTLYERCDKENGVSFSVYCQEKKSAGNALLIAAQFNKALKGDSGMLKWLGTFRLGQKETNLDDIEESSRRGAANAVREIEEENRARARAVSGPPMETQQPLLDKGFPGEASQIPDELGTEGAI